MSAPRMAVTSGSSLGNYRPSFQTAPVEKLCSCVRVDIPASVAYRYGPDYSDEQRKATTRFLFEDTDNARIVNADCPICNAFGLLPNASGLARPDEKETPDAR